MECAQCPAPRPDQYAQFNDSGPLPVANAPTHALCKIMMPYAPTINSPTPNPKSMPRRLIPKTEEGESEATLGQCGSEGRPIGLSFLPISHSILGCGALGEQVRGIATLTTKPEEEAFNASHFQIRCGCSDAMTA